MQCVIDSSLHGRSYCQNYENCKSVEPQGLQLPCETMLEIELAEFPPAPESKPRGRHKYVDVKAILLEHWPSKDAELTVAEFSGIVEKTATTTRRYLNDGVALGLLEKAGMDGLSVVYGWKGSDCVSCRRNHQT